MSCVEVECPDPDCGFRANHNGCHVDTDGLCPLCGRRLIVSFDEKFYHAQITIPNRRPTSAHNRIQRSDESTLELPE